jgi:diaminopimelate decarboxylase
MSKSLYAKPVLKKEMSGKMNKYGCSYNHGFRDEIDGARIQDIVAIHGSPVFVFSERAIRDKYRDVYREFSSRFPRVRFSWSYKTNYLDAICALFHQEGELAEVVSDFEYQKARRLGVAGSAIIYNGPFKPVESLRIAFEEGAIVNLDSIDEIFKAENVAKEIGKPVNVGIRLNMDTGIYPQWTRFGFNLDNSSAFDAAQRIRASKWLNLTGLHSHIGTFILEPKAYSAQVQKTIDFMKVLEKDLGMKIDYLDFGGGFPSRNKLKGIYLPPEVSVPPIEQYAEAICSTLLRHLAPYEYPAVIFETGRALIDEAGYLITTIEGVKRLPDGTRSYVVDAGVNLLYTSTWYNFRVEVDRPVEGNCENSVVFGPLCMNIDVVVENASLPPLSRGQRLIISPVGAYNVTQWMQFIRYRPAVVMVMEDGVVEEIRRAEVLEDITSLESIPEKLRNLDSRDSRLPERGFDILSRTCADQTCSEGVLPAVFRKVRNAT